MARTRLRLAPVVAALCVGGVLTMRHHKPVRPKSEVRPQHNLFNDTLAFFDGFHLLWDLGYVSWDNNCSETNRSRSSVGDVDVEEIRCGLGANSAWRLPEAQPRRLSNVELIRRSLPRQLQFDGLEPRQGYLYLPHRAMPSVAAPFAASQRIDLSTVDFIVGGSLLYALATGDFGRMDYTVQRWRKTVLIRRFCVRPDFVNLKDKGLKFKRLVTGKRMNEILMNEMAVQHLQLLRIGKHTVLFIAEVDAVDEHGRQVEVKTVSRPNWRQVLFQMLAKGSTKLVHGIINFNGQRRGTQYLSHIDEFDLPDIIQWTTTHAERQRFASNIVNGFSLIRSRVFNKSAHAHGSLFRMNATEFFPPTRTELVWPHSPKLYPLTERNRSLLPAASVLHALFPSRQ